MLTIFVEEVELQKRTNNHFFHFLCELTDYSFSFGFIFSQLKMRKNFHFAISLLWKLTLQFWNGLEARNWLSGNHKKLTIPIRTNNLQVWIKLAFGYPFCLECIRMNPNCLNPDNISFNTNVHWVWIRIWILTVWIWLSPELYLTVWNPTLSQYFLEFRIHLARGISIV